VTLALLGMAGASRAQLETPKEPPEPKALPAVQTLLDDAKTHLTAQRPAEALAAAERGLAAASAEKDGAGEAQAQRLRARALSTLNRSEEALAAWEGAASAWALTGDGPGQVEALAAMATQLDAKQPDKAAALRGQALKLGQSESRRPLAAAQALQNAGHAYYDRRALDKARELFLVALSLRERQAPNSLEVAESFNSLGSVADKQMDLPAAREYFRKALAIGLEKAPKSLEVAGTLNGLGTMAWRQGDLVGARDYFRKALAIREEKAPNSLGLAVNNNNLGNVSALQGDSATARECFRKALVIGQEQAPKSLDVAASLNGLGIVARYEGDLSSARDYHRKALAILEETAPNSLELGQALNNLGNVAWRQGDLASAREYYQKALVIKEEKAPNSLDVASSLNNLGIVADKQGDLASAREYHRKALAIKEQKAPNSLDVTWSLNNLGLLAWRQGDLAAARDYQQKALAIAEKKAPNSLPVATSLNFLGKIAAQQGDSPGAREYYRKGLTIQEKVAPDSLNVASSLLDLGDVASQEGNLVAAREYYRKALAIREEKAPGSLEMAESLYSLGKMAEKQGDWAVAKEHFSRAWQLVQNQTGALSGDEARQAFGRSTQYYAARLIRSQMALSEPEAAFTTLEESRAQALRQLLLEKQGLSKAVGTKLWSEYEQAVAARDRAEQAASKASIAELVAQRDIEAKQKEDAASELLAKTQEARKAATKKSEEAQSAYTQARVKADTLWAEIQKTLPRALAPSLLGLKQASRALPSGTLFIAFSVGDERTDVFFLRSEARSESSLALSTYSVEITNKKLQRLVEQFRAQVVSPSRRTAGATGGRALFASLFPKTARKHIAGADRLLISPDGPLWEVPFAALVTNASDAPHYLGADKAITYTPSLALFAQARSEPRRLAAGDKLSAVVVGHPIFNRPLVAVASSKRASAHRETKHTVATPTEHVRGLGERGNLFLDGARPEPLPETEREAFLIAQLYSTTPLIREQATEAALRQQIATADVIHLATHGYLHPVRAMSSGVLLTVPVKEPEPGDTDNDGALQAWEIYSQLKLKAELVVLSACDSGRGQEVKGEGLVGLTRALQYAGARSIVASQWKVADQSTASLMVAFHRALRQGLPKDEALRRAMAHVRQNPATSHPYYWAPFILVGDSDNSVLATAETNNGAAENATKSQ
jgi:CHAT domain-containing protein/Tfp pilus assembly protein PilF